MGKTVVTGYHPSKASQSMVSAVLLLLPVVAIVFIDIALVYYQFALTPSVDLKNLVPATALVNTGWLLDKISIVGGVILAIMALQHLFITQSLSLFILSAGGLAVHLATTFIVDTAIVTPIIASNALHLFG